MRRKTFFALKRISFLLPIMFYTKQNIFFSSNFQFKTSISPPHHPHPPLDLFQFDYNSQVSKRMATLKMTSQMTSKRPLNFYFSLTKIEAADSWPPIRKNLLRHRWPSCGSWARWWPSEFRCSTTRSLFFKFR